MQASLDVRRKEAGVILQMPTMGFFQGTNRTLLILAKPETVS